MSWLCVGGVALTVVASPAVISGCTIFNRIDTCDAPADRDHQVNSTTSGDQFTTYGRSLVRLKAGLYIAAWISQPDTSPTAPSELRATVLREDGEIVPPCGGSSGDVTISTATDQIVGRPAVAVGPTDDTPVFFAWRSSPAGTTIDQGTGTILVRLMKQDLCPWNDPPEVLTASDATDNGAAPVVAVRSDGEEALVAWTSIGPPPDLVGPVTIRSRPVGVVHNAAGQVENNACNNMAAPCTHSMVSLASGPTITAFQDGYALAWGEPRQDGRTGFDVRLQVLDRVGMVRPDHGGLADHRGQRPFGDVSTIGLASAATATQVLVVAAGEPLEQAPLSDDEQVYLERFDASGSLGAPEQVNSITAGANERPAIMIVGDGGAFVAWTATDANATGSDVFGRVLDPSGTPLFTGLNCGTEDFPLSSGGNAHRKGPSLAGSGTTAVAIFADDTTAPGGTDVFGLSVHARRFDLGHLVPGLR
jgi:hypothetical protein